MIAARNLVVLAVALLAAFDPADVEGDRILRRVPVPAENRRHGEVRILRRGDTVVVQTVLHTKVLRRAAGEIARKERRGWPAGEPGAEPSDRYVDALKSIVDSVRERARSRDASEDRFRELRIDFVARAGRGTVILSGAEVLEEEDGLRLTAVVPPFEVLDLSVDYVRRNMALIVADAFEVSTGQAEELLSSAE